MTIRKLTKTKLKAKQPVIKKLVRELDRVFSIFIRKRDHNKCYTCGKEMTISDSQCGHYVSRTYLSTRWDEQNCHCQCVGCNVFRKGNMTEYSERLEKQFGYGIIQELNKRKKVVTKFTADKLTELINHYKKLI